MTLARPVSSTKIIATIGPASNSAAIMRKMIRAGMAVARLNFSHGTHAEHRRTYDLIRNISKELDKPIAIVQDLQGPKIRIGSLETGQIQMQKGQIFELTAELQEGHSHQIPVDIQAFSQEILKGQRVLFADGHL